MIPVPFTTTHVAVALHTFPALRSVRLRFRSRSLFSFFLYGCRLPDSLLVGFCTFTATLLRCSRITGCRLPVGYVVLRSVYVPFPVGWFCRLRTILPGFGCRSPDSHVYATHRSSTFVPLPSSRLRSFCGYPGLHTTAAYRCVRGYGYAHTVYVATAFTAVAVAVTFCRLRGYTRLYTVTTVCWITAMHTDWFMPRGCGWFLQLRLPLRLLRCYLPHTLVRGLVLVGLHTVRSTWFCTHTVRSWICLPVPFTPVAVHTTHSYRGSGLRLPTLHCRSLPCYVWFITTRFTPRSGSAVAFCYHTWFGSRCYLCGYRLRWLPHYALPLPGWVTYRLRTGCRLLPRFTYRVGLRTHTVPGYTWLRLPGTFTAATYLVYCVNTPGSPLRTAPPFAFGLHWLDCYVHTTYVPAAPFTLRLRCYRFVVTFAVGYAV